MKVEMSEKKGKILRLILFIVRCVLVQLLPIVRRLYMRWEPTDQETNIAMIEWSAVYLAYLLIELFFRLSARKAKKEPVFLKLLIFAAVISPVYLWILFLTVTSVRDYGGTGPIGSFVSGVMEFRFVMWPYTAFLIYETVLAFIISSLNKKTFPKNKAVPAAEPSGSYARQGMQ